MKALLGRSDWKLEFEKEGVRVMTWKTPEGYQCTKGTGVMDYDPQDIVDFLRD